MRGHANFRAARGSFVALVAALASANGTAALPRVDGTVANGALLWPPQMRRHIRRAAYKRRRSAGFDRR